MPKTAFDAKIFLATERLGQTIVSFAANAVVYQQGAKADSVYYILTGKVKLCVTSKQGKEAVIAILGAGDFFGEGCLIGQTSRLGSAKMMEASEVTRVRKTEMARLLREELTFGEFFTRHLLVRNSRIEEDLIDQLFNSSEKRLARALLLLANFGKDGGPQPITTPVSQETLAEMVGTTRSRVSQFMNKFRRLGFISYNGHLRVHSSLLSVVLHESSRDITSN